MQKISLSWMIKINIYLYNSVAYIEVLMVYRHCIFYHLHVTELYNNAVYVFKVLIHPEGCHRQIVETCRNVFCS
jgi:hypothetical protein